MGEPAPPLLTVIVPVRDRRASLRRLLDALAAQTFQDFEVVVVDDGSTDGTAGEVESDIAAGRRVRLLRNSGRGATEARRAGVASTAAPFLAFTDSDCVPAPGWMAAGIDALHEGADVVNGATRPMRVAGPLDRTVASGEEGLYPTCNVFYRRSAYEEAGGFDPGAAARLGFRWGRRAQGLGFGEDTLLAWRVRRRGRAVYAPAALVEHEVLPPDLIDTFSRTVQMAAFPALVREVPELRGTALLRRGVVLGDWSRVPLYALAAGVVARRPALMAGSLAVWLALLAQRLRRSGVPVGLAASAVPGRLCVDAVATGALVVGSVRARTIVL